ncbi:MAG TPA: hypothetical protein ENJ01_09730 [Gammaproteobacteria bacterium]|nr:hypothetical protein [Gammaproteobacteria bacterium]
MRKTLHILTNLYLLVALFTPLPVYLAHLMGTHEGDTGLLALAPAELFVLVVLLGFPLLTLRRIMPELGRHPVQPELPTAQAGGHPHPPRG